MEKKNKRKKIISEKSWTREVKRGINKKTKKKDNK